MSTKHESDLFGKPASASKKSLVLAAADKKQLTKAQQAFNRLVKKVESLRGAIKKEIARLDDVAKEFTDQVAPLDEKLVGVRQQFVLLVGPYLMNDQITAKDKKVLSEMLADQIGMIHDRLGSIPEEIEPFFKLVHGQSLKEAQQAQWDEDREQLMEMAREMGMKNVDFSKIKRDMPPEEAAAEAMRLVMQMKQEHERILAEEELKKSKKKKSRSVQKKEDLAKQAEEARKRSISKIYRELARALHPDLEQDEALKPRKTELMQKLTEAYRSNDLHTILQLELEWIAGESDNIERLTDEKLAVYNKMLQEQVRDLEDELGSVISQPHYSHIVQHHPYLDMVGVIDCKAEKAATKQAIKSINECIRTVQQGNPIREIRNIIKTYRADKRQMADDPFGF